MAQSRLLNKEFSAVRVYDPIRGVESEIASKNYITSTLQSGSLVPLTAGTGLSLVGNSFSVNTLLPHVTQVGTLSSLIVNGNSSIQGILDLGGNKLTGVGTPTNYTDGINKGYVDTVIANLPLSSQLVGGNGISFSGNVVSVNSSQLTSIGYLTSLTVNGPAFLSQGADLNGQKIVNLSPPTQTFDCATKGYVDSVSIPITAGNGLNVSQGVFNVNSSQPTITSLGPQNSLVVIGQATVRNPVNLTDVANKLYVDSSIGASALPGTGIIKVGQTISVSPIQPQITTIGSLTSLVVSGNVPTVSPTTGSIVVTGGVGVSGSVSVAGNVTVNGTITLNTAPTNPTDSSSKSYVDSSIINNTPVAGVGITKSGTTLSINSLQSQITQVGTLSGLSSSGPIIISSAASATSPTSGGALQVAGDVGINGAVYIAGNTVFTGNRVTVPPTVNSSDACQKSYADSLISSPGVGLTKTGNVFSVNSTQTQITSIGSLTSLSVNGSVSFGFQYVTPTTGATIVLSGTSAGIIINPATDLSTLTLNFPVVGDGEILCITCSRNVSTLTIAGAVFANGSLPSQLTSGIPLRFVFNFTSGLWFIV